MGYLKYQGFYTNEDGTSLCIKAFMNDSELSAVQSSVVTLDNQGAPSAGTADIMVSKGSPMPVITLSSRDGYEFGGYYTQINGGGARYYNSDGSSDMVWNMSGDITLYADWKPANLTDNSGEISGGESGVSSFKVYLTNDFSEYVNAAGIFTADEKSSIANGVDSKVYLAVNGIDTSAVAESDRIKFESIAKESIGGNVRTNYLDISLFKQVGNSGAVTVHEPGAMMKITIVVSDDMILKDSGYVRNYHILRLHDGSVDMLACDFDNLKHELSFLTDRFSTYAIAYSDEAVPASDSLPGETGGAAKASESVKDDGAGKDAKSDKIADNDNFAISDSGTKDRLVVDSKTDKKSTSKDRNVTVAPKTGDVDIKAYVLVIMLAGIAVVSISSCIRRRETKK